MKGKKRQREKIKTSRNTKSKKGRKKERERGMKLAMGGVRFLHTSRLFAQSNTRGHMSMTALVGDDGITLGTGDRFLAPHFPASLRL